MSPDYGGRDKPQWSPDGSKIIFQVSRDDIGTEIYVKNINGTGLAQLTNTPGDNFKPSWQPLAPAACHNPIDCADFFVTQHYRDFVSREPDPDGLAFWTNEITSCGSDLQCIEVKRINRSAAFFLSIEFQNTGYLVERMYKTAYAFVLMQYFGYLRRDPNAAPDSNYAGYLFWLDKLDSFGGDFIQAEMVKAFLQSVEYRQRFVQ